MRFYLDGVGGIPGLKQASDARMAKPFTFEGNLTVLGTLTTGGESSAAQVITIPNNGNAVALTINQNDITNNPNAVAVNNIGSQFGLLVTQAGTGEAMKISNSSTGSVPALEINDTNTTGTYPSLFIVSTRGAGGAIQAQHNPASNSTLPLQINAGTQTITGAVTDGMHGSISLRPVYSAATIQTVTRHNYLDIVDATLSGAGPAALTDSAVMRFNAAAGTHKAVDGATTKTTPGTVNAWVKININGTLYFIPAYTSKTS